MSTALSPLADLALVLPGISSRRWLERRADFRGWGEGLMPTGARP